MTSGGRAGHVLSRRALNRALLARQFLLERVPMSVGDMLEALVGMQGQTPLSPYLALWSRIAPFDPAELSAMLAERSAVRITLMRTTIHLTTARDALRLRPVMQDVLERGFRSGSPFGRRLGDMDVGPVVDAGRALLEERARTAAELRLLLAERWPDADAEAMGMACRYLLPLVHVPPRGLWRQSGPARMTTAEAWLGQPLASDTRPDDAVLRYLRAFGPATVSDIRTWSWLSGLREVVERLRPHLRTFRDEEGRELHDVPDGLLPDPDTPAQPRFLPDFDNILLSHADRSRVAGRRDMPWDRWEFGSLLVDGWLRGTWRLTEARGDSAPLLRIGLFDALSSEEEGAVRAEAAGMVAFLAPDAVAVGIEFYPGVPNRMS